MEVKCWWDTDPLNAVFWRFPNWLRFIITNIITNSSRLSPGELRPMRRRACSLISHQCTAFPQSLEGKQTQPLIPTIPEDLLLHPTTAPPPSHTRAHNTLGPISPRDDLFVHTAPFHSAPRAGLSCGYACPCFVAFSLPSRPLQSVVSPACSHSKLNWWTHSWPPRVVLITTRSLSHSRRLMISSNCRNVSLFLCTETWCPNKQHRVAVLHQIGLVCCI